MPRLTLGDLKQQVYSRLEDNDQMFQESEVTNAINEAIACINMICGWYQKTYSVSSTTTIAGRHIYEVPHEIIFPQRVIFDNQIMEKSSLSAISNDYPNFMQDTSDSTGKQVSRWCPLGIKKFVLHPADSVGGATLQVTGISEIDTLLNDTDMIYIPKEGVTAVCDYAAHVVQCKMQGLPFYQSMSYYNNYQLLVKLNKYWRSYSQPTMYFDEQSKVQG